jgi:hypothetical protein
MQEQQVHQLWKSKLLLQQKGSCQEGCAKKEIVH